jgi:multiple sugar transport system permease protein
MNRGTRFVARRTVWYVVCTALAVLFIAPLAWSAWASVHGAQATGGASGYGVDNYRRLLRFGEGLWVYLGNSIAVSVMTVVGTLVVTVLGGYAFSRFNFPGKNLLFFASLAILMIPHVTILIPLYVIIGKIGLQNSLVGLSLVLIMFQLPFALFMMRNSFEALPKELEEAALLDGCSSFGALVRILVRAVRPAMITVGLFAFLASWNEFIAPLIFLTQGSKYTLPVALVNLRSGEFGTIDLGALQAGIVVTAIPCLLLFLALQRHYIRGFAAGAVRG